MYLLGVFLHTMFADTSLRVHTSTVFLPRTLSSGHRFGTSCSLSSYSNLPVLDNTDLAMHGIRIFMSASELSLVSRFGACFWLRLKR